MTFTSRRENNLEKRRTASETRLLVLMACNRILRRGVLTDLTLENVAAEAGLSKGGLLYHFPNKEALIEALFMHHNQLFEERVELLAAAEDEPLGAWLRAYAKALIEQIADPSNASLYASLFAAEEQYVGAHSLMNGKWFQWERRAKNSGLDPGRAELVRLAVDGLWFAQMHNYAPPDPARREQIEEMILQMTFNPKPLHG
jgi:AcrR family transcriptional regulator